MFPSQPLPFIFHLFFTFTNSKIKCRIKVASDWIRTRVLRCRNQPLPQLCHKRFVSVRGKLWRWEEAQGPKVKRAFSSSSCFCSSRFQNFNTICSRLPKWLLSYFSQQLSFYFLIVVFVFTQCDHIWQNFANFAKNKKYLTRFLRFI